MPGLAAAARAAHRITPGPGWDAVLAPRAQSGHVRPPISLIEADCNCDSNSSDQLGKRQCDRQQRRTLARSVATWDMPTPKRTVVRGLRLTENLAYALRARAPEMSPNRHQQPTIITSSNART